jgi:RNA-directed DNA polymerase
MDDCTKTQRSFARKAVHHPEHRFADLYHLICREEWIATALRAVLANAGSRTAGIDGMTKKQLAGDDAKQRFVRALQAELKAGRFKPRPVRRHFIPKAGGKRRPLGISTLKDRVVQMLLKLLLEPIWEADFLPCSHGFRPGHRTMDCIAPLYGLMNPRVKCYWVVEGDVRGCFDHVDHTILARLVERRVADRRIVALIRSFLEAGVMEGDSIQATNEGTPQGNIVSPLLTNLYLTELDRYWWDHYGGLTRHQKSRRRRAGQGNPVLLRYADDFILVTNGPKQEAFRLREEFRQYLAERLKLDLALEKTAVTHVNDGFDFLGFYIRRYRHPWGGSPVVLVKPSKKNRERLKAKIRDMTGRHRLVDDAAFKVVALNRVLRGWIGYYRHANVKKVADGLDFWVAGRLAAWLGAKHGWGIRRVLRTYHHRQGGRKTFAVTDERGRRTYLYGMATLPLTRYPVQRRSNPYLDGVPTTLTPSPGPPDLARAWSGNTRTQGWRHKRSLVLQRDGYRCQNPTCGTDARLEVHHKRWRKHGGDDHPTNLTTLCADCHRREQQGALLVNW